MFQQLTNLVAEASLWAYLVVLLFSFSDVLFPVVPSEASVITAGVLAANGDLNLPLILAAAATGAFAGDNTAYWLGRRYGERAQRRFFSGEKGQRRIGWAARQLHSRGGELILVGRFIPGGRTAVTLTAGTVRYRWPRFAVFDLLAAVLWAVYAGLLGYIGGRTFEHGWTGLAFALGIALGVTATTEGVRMLLQHRRGRITTSRDSAAHARPEARRRPASRR